MKKIYLWPACLAVIYTASIIIIVSPNVPRVAIVPPITPVPTASDIIEVLPTEIPQIKISSQLLGVTFSYPQYLKITNQKNQIILTNGLKVTYTSPKPDQIKVDNFKVIFSKVTSTPNYDSTITRGKYIILREWAGVEGTGEENFYINTSPKEWLKVSSKFYLDNDVSIKDRQKTNYIPNEMQKEVVDQILSSLVIEKSNTKKYSCPDKQWVDCMPGPGPTKAQCNPDFLEWAKGNCPNFQGAAL